MKLVRVLLSGSLILLSQARFAYSAEPVPVDSHKVAKLADLGVMFGNILAATSALASFAALIMLIWGGFKYITSQGDPKAVDAARGTLTWAVMGLVMLIVSWLVLVFIEQFTGVNVTKFCVGLTCPIN